MTCQANKRASRTVPTPEDLKRHQILLDSVYAWMRRTRATQQTLVRCIQEFWRKRGDSNYVCDHTLLSRILNPVEPHVPTPHRPKSMRILQAATIICASADDPNIVADAPDEDQDWITDEDQAFKLHRARLRQLREHGRGDLFRSLHRIGEFCAAARWMDDARSSNELSETYRQRACENVLLTLAALIDPGCGDKQLKDVLVEQGVGATDAQRLVDAQIRRVQEILGGPARATVNMRAYAGAVLFHAGQREQGGAMLLEAVAASHSTAHRHDPHWETALELLERLLVCADAWAEPFADDVLAIARQQHKAAAGGWALLQRAWGCVTLSNVRQQWAAKAPELVRELDAAAHLDESVASRSPRRQRSRAARSGAKTVAATLAIASALLCGLMSFSAASADQTASPMAAAPTPVEEEQWAIRGREASNPQPPPTKGPESEPPVT